MSAMPRLSIFIPSIPTACSCLAESLINLSFSAAAPLFALRPFGLLPRSEQEREEDSGGGAGGDGGEGKVRRSRKGGIMKHTCAHMGLFLHRGEQSVEVDKSYFEPFGTFIVGPIGPMMPTQGFLLAETSSPLHVIK